VHFRKKVRLKMRQRRRKRKRKNQRAKRRRRESIPRRKANNYSATLSLNSIDNCVPLFHHTSVATSVAASALQTRLFRYLTGVTSQDDKMPLVVIKLNVDVLRPKVRLKDSGAKTDSHGERSFLYLDADVIIIVVS